jgi:hypothetical protein
MDSRSNRGLTRVLALLVFSYVFGFANDTGRAFPASPASVIRRVLGIGIDLVLDGSALLTSLDTRSYKHNSDT